MLSYLILICGLKYRVVPGLVPRFLVGEMCRITDLKCMTKILYDLLVNYEPTAIYSFS